MLLLFELTARFPQLDFVSFHEVKGMMFSKTKKSTRCHFLFSYTVQLSYDPQQVKYLPYGKPWEKIPRETFFTLFP